MHDEPLFRRRVKEKQGEILVVSQDELNWVNFNWFKQYRQCLYRNSIFRVAEKYLAMSSSITNIVCFSLASLSHLHNI